jgi:hypothetical protein
MAFEVRYAKVGEGKIAHKVIVWSAILPSDIAKELVAQSKEKVEKDG